MPDDMKQTTATNDLNDSRGSPQTPCPLVQPLPNLAPNPTKKPPAIASK